MITHDVHRKETTEILRVLSQYGALKKEQIFRLFPDREEMVEKVITSLLKQGRIFYICQEDLLSVDEKEGLQPNYSTILSFWVMLDFIDKVDYHYAGDFPVQLGFLAHGELYEIIYAPQGHEILITQAVSSLKEKEAPKRLVLIDQIDQIKKLSINSVVGYATAALSGAVQYYRLE